MNNLIGRYDDLRSRLADDFYGLNDFYFKFNDPRGQIGLRGVDDTKTASIRFCRGDEIDPAKIKPTSRAITRISGRFDLAGDDLDGAINEANRILQNYRAQTHDVFMTSFKGLRDDGFYRRRLDFKIAGKILSKSLGKFSPKTVETFQTDLFSAATNLPVSA
jgi:hypothetical protein